MEKLLEEVLNDAGLESDGFTSDTIGAVVRYDTSYFVKVSSSYKNWYIKNIDMPESDRIAIINELKSLCDMYVEEYKLEDRDPEFIYKYNIEGLLISSNRIQEALAGNAVDTNINGENNAEQPEITLHNYEGNRFPPNDEVKLIVHRLLIGNSKILVFCNQSNTSLATTTIRTLVDNQLKSIEENKYYRIKNNISFLMTSSSYYIASVDYFEKAFSFDSQISRKKQEAMRTLADCQLVEGLNLVVPELNKGYMARSVSMIRMNQYEIQAYVKKNERAISTFCREYQVGVSFDLTTNKLTVTDGKTASLFLTYLFSNRMAQNIEGELVYYKTFGKLNKSSTVSA